MIENKPEEYVCVRVQIVHVKKGFWGFKDTILGFTTLIPNNVKQAEKVFKRIQRDFKKYGIEMKLREVDKP